MNRAKRAHQNQVENLGPYAAIILVAHLVGVHNTWTVGGAIAYPVLRVVFSALYIAGVPNVRSWVFSCSVAAELVIAAQLLV